MKYGSGDDGTTSLLGGVRVPKNDPRVEALGTLDELNAIIGLARTLTGYQDVKDVLLRIQRSLHVVGAEMASIGTPSYKEMVNYNMVRELENLIELYEHEVREIKGFIIPYGAISSAVLHIARCVARRLERRTVSLGVSFHMNKALLAYLNRLSTLLFVLARVINTRGYVEEEVLKVKNTTDDES